MSMTLSLNPCRSLLNEIRRNRNINDLLCESAMSDWYENPSTEVYGE